ncbi:hypothetical protein PsorP6_005303 [Peronosclerospora sorghi]|uniref:Uncharacterized protein n=1 Tax=Peronosclerospora sorghi TaxID=230839 RepID=A0ACC0W3Z6_9STRA|nr:hypothetical protein PsorP6_005303 [Peronosclerospora sorghi]
MENRLQIMGMVRSAFESRVQSDSNVALAASATVPYSVQYEALVFLTAFIKSLYVLKPTERSRVELSKQMILLMDEIFIKLDYCSQPTFVSCAVLTFLGDFLHLFKFWRSQTRFDTAACLESIYFNWLEQCLLWLLQSSCTLMTLQRLNDSNSASVTAQNVFVANFSSYPFLQQWLLFVSRLGAAYLAAVVTENKRVTQELPTWSGGSMKQQLSRQKLLTILAEQDDVMIEVLNGLIQITTLAHDLNDTSCPLAQWNPSLTTYVVAEFDPDLLFADLVETLEQDHLVLLDFLVSNETEMLEYLMRYLRHLGTNWRRSKQTLKDYKRLESVMSVLIRLRLEIDRLVAADLFPYSTGPLTGRLVTIEQLYEEEEKNAQQE